MLRDADMSFATAVELGAISTVTGSVGREVSWALNSRHWVSVRPASGFTALIINLATSAS